MIGTGVLVGFGVGLIVALIGLVGLLFGELTVREWAGMAGRFAVVTTLLGIAFSGALALSARGRSLSSLSLGFVASIGAGAGLMYWLTIGFMNAFAEWTLSMALVNLAVLTVMGAGAATGALLVARKARGALKSVDDPGSIGEGSPRDGVVRAERGITFAERDR